MSVTATVSYVMYKLAVVLLPIFLAVFLAFALYPLANIIGRVRVGQGTIHLSRVVAIILAFLTLGLVVAVSIGFILLPLFGEINELLVKMPDVLQANKSGLEDILNDPSTFPVLPSSFAMLLDDIVSWAMGFVAGMGRNLLTSSMDIAKNLIGLAIVPFLAFYFVKDWRELRAMLISFFSYDVQPRAAHIIDEIGRTLSAYIQGLGKLSLIAGFCITIGTAWLGLEFPFVLGFLALLAETIPMVGPIIGAVPAIFIAYGQSSTDAFHVALFYLIFYQIDANFIMPKVMGEQIDLHPVILIISLLIGAKMFGIVGMLFAVPVAAVYRVLYKELWHEGEGENA
ncbi:MAG: AI-2E family transporter [Phascolarctobacterium sp.]|nr:AI-2E family transporter [Phascolarctobacterium sp.]MBR2140096.1 AI-2E family transporter [Phascolarctobacterium sp.]